MDRLFSRYNSWLTRRPYLSQMVTAGGLWLLGDLLSQKLQGSQQIDFRRMSIMTTFGILGAGKSALWSTGNWSYLLLLTPHRTGLRVLVYAFGSTADTAHVCQDIG